MPIEHLQNPGQSRFSAEISGGQRRSATSRRARASTTRCPRRSSGTRRRGRCSATSAASACGRPAPGRPPRAAIVGPLRPRLGDRPLLLRGRARRVQPQECRGEDRRRRSDHRTCAMASLLVGFEQRSALRASSTAAPRSSSPCASSRRRPPPPLPPAASARRRRCRP